MSKPYIIATAAVISLAFSGVSTLLCAAEATTVSKANAKTLLAAMEAQKAKRCPEAISKSKEALATPDKNSYDSYVAYGIMAYCYQVQGNNAELMTALQGKLDSGHLSAAEQPTTLKNMYATAFALKDYGKAQELGQRMIRSGIGGSDTYDQVAVAMVQDGKQAEAIKFLSDYVKETESRGQKPSENAMSRLRDLQEKSGNTAAASQTMEGMVRHFRKPEYWNPLLHTLSRDATMNERQKLHVFRLKMATGNLKRCPDFTDMEELAMAAGMAGESQKVIEQALGAKVCSGSDNDRLQRHIRTNSNVVAEDKAKFAKLQTDAAASKTGELDIAVGAQLFGYGEYAKAAESLQRGISKGGLKNLADAQLTLGVAQMRAGNKAEAIKTFRSVKGDPRSERIASLWMLYVGA